MDELQKFISLYNRKPVDVDNFPPYNPFQCVDLVDQWSIFLGGPNMSGNAKDYAGRSNYKFDWIPKGGTPQAGDIVVWGPPMGGGYGHVGIFVDGNANDFRSFDQNYPEGDWAGLDRHTGDTQYVKGYMRPKGINMSTQAEKEREELRNLFWQSNYKVAELCYQLYEGRNASDAEKRQWINVHPVDKIVEGIRQGRKPLTENEATERLNKVKEALK